MLLCEPLLELVLFVVTAIDLRNGAEPDWKHGLAAALHRLHRRPRPLHDQVARRPGRPPLRRAARRRSKPPRYGMARAAPRVEGSGRPLRSSRRSVAVRPAPGGGLVRRRRRATSARCATWQRKMLRRDRHQRDRRLSVHALPEAGPARRAGNPSAASVTTRACADGAGRERPGRRPDRGLLSAPRPAPTARRRPPCSPSGPG